MRVDQRDVVDEILGYARRIAIVGLSPRPGRPSHGVASRLIAQGYEVVPVNPNADDVFGIPAYPTLSEVPGDIDVVNVFRRHEHLAGVAEETLERGARALWIQTGLWSDEARILAGEAGIDYVEDRCIAVEVGRLSHEMALPPQGF